MSRRIFLCSGRPAAGPWRGIRGILGLTALVFVAAGQAAPPVASAGRALEQTGILVDLAGRNGAAGSDASSRLNEMLEVAGARRSLLLGLIEQAPGEVLRLALPDRVRRSLPAPVRAYVEERLELTGRLVVRYEHDAAGSRLVHELVSDGRDVRLHFSRDVPGWTSGARVSVGGVLLGGAMAVSDGNVLTQNLDPSGADSGAESTGAVATVPGALGDQRTLVLLVNWQDDPSDQPYTISEAHEIVFGSVTDLILENSSYRTWLTGEVHGWYTLPLPRPTDPTTCKHGAVSEAAQDAARNDGVDPAAFDHLVYVFPQTPCFPSGTATVGGQPTEMWINGAWFALKTVAHEFGHNLGLFHAGAQECGSAILGSDCVIYPYGDSLDVMGNRSLGHFNGYKKERLGWLDPIEGTIATADADGMYALEPYETPVGGSTKVLKIFKGSDPATGEPVWYYVEHRQATGFDDFLAGNDNVTNGIVVRMATETSAPKPVSTLLLDMTPASQEYDDWQDPALPFDAVFTDPASGLSLVGHLAADGGAIVDVRHGSAACVTTSPIPSLPAQTTVWAAAGAPVSLDVSVTNVDSDACQDATFELNAAGPSGWSVDFEPHMLTLAPGGVGGATLIVVSPADASDGIYDVEMVISRAGVGNEVLLTASVGISGALTNEAPIARDDSAETPQGTSVPIVVLANDSDPDNDPLAVLGLTQPANGTVGIGADGTVVYTPKGRSKGQDSFTYTISDGSAEATATVVVTVVGKNGGSGGGGGGAGGGKGKGKNP